ncbi:MAG: hypothetical protein DI536_09040 [Archangium gephyra]|uniref:Disintegrin domain-containing protein n=1 Tax=Archangium gephyra TaxID=48 RepID=A0A2W5TH60_9BACT|nr:MAG: hypothetical protein DI536_09040 [Archangium gephyra]
MRGQLMRDALRWRWRLRDGREVRQGACIGTLDDGDACSADALCGSGHCVDGVCCNTSCEGACEACNVAGLEGRCAAVEGEPRGARAACAGEGTCASRCDGVRRDACAWPDDATSCAERQCVGGAVVGASRCDGAGACVAPAPLRCEAGCEAGECTGQVPVPSGCSTAGGPLALVLALWLARRQRRAA